MMTWFVDRLAHLCLTYRKTVLLALAAITVLTASQMPKVAFDNALEIWFLDDDPALLSHQELIATFGSDELVMIGLEAPDVFAPDVLARIDRVTRAVEQAPHVEKVFSLTNIEAITGDAGTLEVGDLIEFPLDEATLPAIRQRALANDLYVGNVVSAAGDFACIIARLPHRTDDFQYKVEAVGAIRDIVDGEPGLRCYLAGGPVVDEQFFYLSERDTVVTTSLMILLLMGMLWWLLRSKLYVALPLVAVILSTVWAMGWMVLAGSRINIITGMLPPLLLAVGVADSMHVLVEYQNRCRRGEEKWPALYAVYRELTLPCLLTSLTTAIGMLALLVSRIQGIREFGIFAALGVVGAFVLSMTLVPIVLSYLPPPRPRAERVSAHGISAEMLHALHIFTMRRGRAIVLVSAALAVVALVGASRVKSESVFMEYFKDSQRVKLDTNRMNDALAGTFTLEVVIDTGLPDGIKDPAVLQHIASLQAFLVQDPEISSTQSITDYFKDLRRAFFDNDQAEYRLPETTEEAAQYLLLYEMDEPDGDIQEYVTFDYRQARLSARVTMESSTRAAQLVDKTNAYIAEHFPPDLAATVTGVALLYANMEDYIRLSLVKGFSIALVAIFVVFCLQMRSVVLGTIAMIPNVFPIVLCLGVMGVTGIHLDGMTAMVAAIAIGLAVDDTIHYVSRVRLYLDEGATMREALRDSTIHVGRALVYTSVTLIAGFGIMMVGSFAPTVNFGLLCALTIAGALTADLILLPVVLRAHARGGGFAGAPGLRGAANAPRETTPERV